MLRSLSGVMRMDKFRSEASLRLYGPVWRREAGYVRRRILKMLHSVNKFWVLRIKTCDRKEKPLRLWDPETPRGTKTTQGGGGRKSRRQTDSGEKATETKWSQVCHQLWVCNRVCVYVWGRKKKPPSFLCSNTKLSLLVLLLAALLSPPPVGPVSVSWWWEWSGGSAGICSFCSELCASKHFLLTTICPSSDLHESWQTWLEEIERAESREERREEKNERQRREREQWFFFSVCRY